MAQQKIRDYINIIVERYLVVDQKYAMIMPLISDEKILSKIDDSLGALGLDPLRVGVFQSVISDLSALVFDNSNNTASLKFLNHMLKDKKLVADLKRDFCAPQAVRWVGSERGFSEELEKIVMNAFSEKNAEEFDNKLSKFFYDMKFLSSHNFEKDLKGARDKMIAHYDVKCVDGNRRLYEPKDFNLKWDSVDRLVEFIEPMIFDLNSIIRGEWFEVEHSKHHHREVSKDFWQRLIGK